MESKDFESSPPSERKAILNRIVIFDEFSMLYSKSDEVLGKDEDITKQVGFESSIITNISHQK